jgi:hypothetical protein
MRCSVACATRVIRSTSTVRRCASRPADDRARSSALAARSGPTGSRPARRARVCVRPEPLPAPRLSAGHGRHRCRCGCAANEHVDRLGRAFGRRLLLFRFFRLELCSLASAFRVPTVPCANDGAAESAAISAVAVQALCRAIIGATLTLGWAQKNSAAMSWVGVNAPLSVDEAQSVWRRSSRGHSGLRCRTKRHRSPIGYGLDARSKRC